MHRSPSDREQLPFLGIGPVSRNTVDAALSAAYRCGSRIMLIPSRSQVDAERFGGGYLGWSTDEFAEYVRARDPRRLALLCRDHGGPWQHPSERSLTAEDEALDSCMESFRNDIRAGFDILHIDSSVERSGEAPFAPAARRLVSLYERCAAAADEAQRAIRFEIGFEPQGVEANDPEQFASQLDEVWAEIMGRGLAGPVFVVAQTGTKVQELSNTGAFLKPESRDAVRARIAAFAETCRERGTLLKAHNCDYLNPADIGALARAGVHSANVAPEFGTAETRVVLRLLGEFQLTKATERFLALAFDSGKWAKWMRADTPATDYERAVISGHYVFETEEFHDIRAELDAVLAARGLPGLRDRIVSELTLLIERYLLAGSDRWYRPEPQLQAG